MSKENKLDGITRLFSQRDSAGRNEENKSKKKTTKASSRWTILKMCTSLRSQSERHSSTGHVSIVYIGGGRCPVAGGVGLGVGGGTC